jgi:hypothetical protein
MSAPRLVLVLLLACGPAPLAACDLDGLPGFHRANPFARAPMFRGTPLPQPQAPGQSEQPGAKAQGRSAPSPMAEPLVRDRTDNPGPISPEDKATLS